MNIIKDLPPMFKEIDAVFHVAGKPVIFCWGKTIFNPQGISIEPALRVHESVHSSRQGSDVEGWWRRYLDDVEFRLEEEIPAHRMELAVRARGRNVNLPALRIAMAKRLASPLYGPMIDVDGALKLLAA